MLGFFILFGMTGKDTVAQDSKVTAKVAATTPVKKD
jgi:hypothetical protein